MLAKQLFFNYIMDLMGDLDQMILPHPAEPNDTTPKSKIQCKSVPTDMSILFESQIPQEQQSQISNSFVAPVEARD
jgi:hypothetical protein